MFIVTIEAKRFPEHFRTRCRRMHKSHERQRRSYEVANHHDDSESVQMPEYTTESRLTSIDSLVEATDTANSSAPTSSANSSVSNVSMGPIAGSLNSAKALFRKRSLVQLLNSYIKAGVEEGAFFNGVSQPVYIVVKINVHPVIEQENFRFFLSEKHCKETAIMT